MRRLRAGGAALCAAVTVVVAGCAAPSPGFRLSPEQRLLMSFEEAMRAERPAEARDAATRLLATEHEPWVQVLVAQAWAAEGNRDEAFRGLSAAIDAIAPDPLRAGPMAIDLAGSLESGSDRWAPLRADPRFPALLARAKSAAWKPGPLAFDVAPAADPPRTPLPQVDSHPLRTIRTEYTLDAVVAGAADDLDRVRRICGWVHGRTRHDGWGIDAPPDALGLLRAAEKGAQWRCVEFGIAVTGCLQAVGIPARTVGGRARDVETLLVGAGHVFAEAWLADRGRWVFVDAQMDIVAVDSDGTPMNSAEFRDSLARAAPPIPYPVGLALCMHYFNIPARSPDGKDIDVMLAPVGSPMPTRFQRMPCDPPGLFTHRLADAYAPPGP